MEKLQVKFCHSLDELNEFLKTLSVTNSTCPHLHTIQYLPDMSAKGNVDIFDINSSVVSIVQYFVDIEEKE